MRCRTSSLIAAGCRSSCTRAVRVVVAVVRVAEAVAAGLAVAGPAGTVEAVVAGRRPARDQGHTQAALVDPGPAQFSSSRKQGR